MGRVSLGHEILRFGWVGLGRIQCQKYIINYLHARNRLFDDYKGKGKNKVDLYSAFIVVPHTQGAQVRITQCYLQITPYLPLPRRRSPDGASPD